VQKFRKKVILMNVSADIVEAAKRKIAERQKGGIRNDGR
jgi:hypothetical protein